MAAVSRGLLRFSLAGRSSSVLSHHRLSASALVQQCRSRGFVSLQENEVSARVGQKRVFQRALINRSSFRQFSDAASPSKETEVLKQLANIIDPDLGQDIVSLGFIKNLKIAGGTVTFDLELTTPGMVPYCSTSAPRDDGY
eukprot:3616126-Rhodomonas_salina.3